MTCLLERHEDEHGEAAEGDEAENRTDLLQQIHSQRVILDPPPGAKPSLITSTTRRARSVSSPLPIRSRSCVERLLDPIRVERPLADGLDDPGLRGRLGVLAVGEELLVELLAGPRTP